MHIPDGFLSPQTCAVCAVAVAPFWVISWTRLKSRFETTTAAHIGLAAAFVFLLQMMNTPIPGGTSGHAVGTALVTIALGPAAAIIAASLALGLQALVFGDGGLLTYSANVLTMAVAPAMLTWAIWQITGQVKSRKKMGILAFGSGYLSALCGATLTGILLGIQPHLFQSVGGSPLYFPLGLRVSLSAMFLSHLFIGIVEGAVTMGAVLALDRLPAFQLFAPQTKRAGWGKVAAVVACMVLLAPVGVVLPTIMGSGASWGEWSPVETAEVAGMSAVPEGMARHAEKYSAPVPDYQFTESSSMAGESTQYVGAALIGVLLVGLICLPLYRMQQTRLKRKTGQI